VTVGRLTPAAVALVVAAGVSVSACGDDGTGPPLSADAERGREIARSNGCSGCHGSAGQGAVGPPFAGLYGSQVELDDGTTVAADAAYLTEAIRDPDATRVAGYPAMPGNDLDDDEIAAVVAYIRELSGEAGS
jgi:cytochrome c oxidase subunit 2